MSDRKNVNKYYPPDWDPSLGSLNTYHNSHPLRSRARHLQDEGILIIRFEMPYDVRCLQCRQSIGRGVRFNAEKSKVGMYYSTTLWEFKMKCSNCGQTLRVRTDPQNRDYQLVQGIAKRFEETDQQAAHNGRIVLDSNSSYSSASASSSSSSSSFHLAALRSASVSRDLDLISLADRSIRVCERDFDANRRLREKFRIEKNQRIEKDREAEKWLGPVGPGEWLQELTEEDQRQVDIIQFTRTNAGTSGGRSKQLELNENEMRRRRYLALRGSGGGWKDEDQAGRRAGSVSSTSVSSSATASSSSSAFGTTRRSDESVNPISMPPLERDSSSLGARTGKGGKHKWNSQEMIEIGSDEEEHHRQVKEQTRKSRDDPDNEREESEKNKRAKNGGDRQSIDTTPNGSIISGSTSVSCGNNSSSGSIGGSRSCSSISRNGSRGRQKHKRQRVHTGSMGGIGADPGSRINVNGSTSNKSKRSESSFVPSATVKSIAAPTCRVSCPSNNTSSNSMLNALDSLVSIYQDDPDEDED